MVPFVHLGSWGVRYLVIYGPSTLISGIQDIIKPHSIGSIGEKNRCTPGISSKNVNEPGRKRACARKSMAPSQPPLARRVMLSHPRSSQKLTTATISGGTCSSLMMMFRTHRGIVRAISTCCSVSCPVIKSLCPGMIPKIRTSAG